MSAAAKRVRRAVVAGAEHTDARLAAMKTTEVAGLVAAIRGDGKTPKPATKAKAIELFWQAAERLPETPEAPKVPEVQDAKAATTDAKKDTRNSDNGTPEKAPKGKRYAIKVDEPEELAKVQTMNPLARRLAEEIRDAGRPLSMAECAAIVGKFSKSKKPEKLVAWHFCKLYRPAGILAESRDGRGA
jgi:hypothetical protein